jgi:pyruvate formate lyase activating enzyme
MMHVALLFVILLIKSDKMTSLSRISGEKTQCLLCPHLCKIAEGKTGICGVRKNTGQKIELITYGVISGYSLDPVEKKPLYHFFPGQNILSIGSYGCNMKCDFCQNFNISQKVPETLESGMTPESLVLSAHSAERNIGLGFTYNEPTIWFEFMRDVATLAKNEGMRTVMVSNGFVNSEPLNQILQFIDAFNIDLKAFNNNTHKKLTGVDLDPVKDSLKQIAGSGRHLEITSLIIPGQNDDEAEMVRQSQWIASELGKNVPLHLSRYFPMYRRDDPATTQETLQRLFEIASTNLNYVYMGNTHSGSGQNTVCPGCGATVTIRSGYNTRLLNLDAEGRCISCGTPIYRNITFF